MFCPWCGREETGNPTFCRGCGRRLIDDSTRIAGAVPPATPAPQLAQYQAKPRVNRVGRVLSGLSAAAVINGAANGLIYFAESGLIAELVVDIISLMIALALLLIAFVPEWISRKLRIKLESGSVFGLVFALLVVAYLVAVALGPEPPGGWWNYGR
ncbi:MAG: hypothetical protein JW753_02485 [Dehalococcoidia bacterium]|nr:hypothetical protein [Dehalococcoidia bacterium]